MKADRAWLHRHQGTTCSGVPSGSALCGMMDSEGAGLYSVLVVMRAECTLIMDCLLSGVLTRTHVDLFSTLERSFLMAWTMDETSQSWT